MEDWSGRKVLIIGAARQGTALAGYLARHGARVILNDRRPLEALASARQELADQPNIQWAAGGHPLELLQGLDLVCVSGGVPLTLPLVVEARRQGLPLSNDSQIFLQAVPCPVIGITGSAGKTTTTTLVGRMAEAALADRPGRAWVGGNIGSPLIADVDRMETHDWVVMELSSFQLELMDRSPRVAAVLNITPNHLDRHGTMAAYTAAKARILQYQPQESAAVLGRDDPGAWRLKEKVSGRLFSFGLEPLPPDEEGTFLIDDDLVLQRLFPEGQMQIERLFPLSEVRLRGEHNLLNVLAACAVAAAAGWATEAMQAGVSGFSGVPHRLEWVRRWGGADWYNDSIATAPERAMAAIRSFDEPLVLLAGGRDKDLPWQDFAALAAERVDHLILFGEAAAVIERALQVHRPGRTTIHRCKGLEEAVRAAADLVEPGDVVLLSPGGTSFDEFEDFEERGRCFVHWVKKLP